MTAEVLKTYGLIAKEDETIIKTTPRPGSWWADYGADCLRCGFKTCESAVVCGGWQYCPKCGRKIIGMVSAQRMELKRGTYLAEKREAYLNELDERRKEHDKADS